eukprot:scaffold203_cov149-Skeletonema_menzelii.AAC.9
MNGPIGVLAISSRSLDRECMMQESLIRDPAKNAKSLSAESYMMSIVLLLSTSEIEEYAYIATADLISAVEIGQGRRALLCYQ